MCLVNQNSQCNVFLPRNANIISEMIFSIAYLSSTVPTDEKFLVTYRYN